ncbi:hypothetical protein JCM3775_000328 [Rhodotorula graminis]
MPAKETLRPVTAFAALDARLPPPPRPAAVIAASTAPSSRTSTRTLAGPEPSTSRDTHPLHPQGEPAQVGEPALLPLRSFAPGPSAPSASRAAARRPQARAQPAPSRTTSTAASTAPQQPATKRTKRILADDDELIAWQLEAHTSGKGKGRAVKDEPVGPSSRSAARSADEVKARPMPSAPTSFRPVSAFDFSPAASSRATSTTPKPSIVAATRTRAPSPSKTSSSMHRLSSLSKPPVAARPSTPRRAAAAPASSSALTTPSQLMRGLPQQLSMPAIKREDGGGSAKAAQMGILARAPPLRDVPPLAGEDGGVDEGGESELWSPRKKKGGYIVSGMAARASAILAATRTDYTLWLHDLSRRLASASSSSATSAGGGLALDELAQALKPAIRLVVVDVPSSSPGDELGAGAGSGSTTPDRRRGAGQKSVLARCRIVLPPSATSSSSSGSDDLVGLVLFSLHERSGSSSSSAAASSVPPPPPAPPPPSSPTKRTTTSSTRPRSLVIPTVPPDLRWVRPGAQAWVWDPFREVVLPPREGADDWRARASERERRSVGEREGQGERERRDVKRDEEGDEQEPEDGPRVEWDEAGLSGRAQRAGATATHEQEGTTRALVCGRFGIVV